MTSHSLHGIFFAQRLPSGFWGRGRQSGRWLCGLTKIPGQGLLIVGMIPSSFHLLLYFFQMIPEDLSAIGFPSVEKEPNHRLE